MAEQVKFNDTISVIIVTYNRLNYLKSTLDAVLRQTYSNLEVIVVGDGHQDEVERYIISLNNERVFYSYVLHCSYPARGRNLGIKKTKGKLIAFCDDDDVWEIDKLKKQVDIFNRNQNLVMCCTNRRTIDARGSIINRKNLKWTPKNCSLRTLLMSNYISYSSVLLKRDVLEKAGCFIDDIKFKAVEDYHLWLRIAYFGQFSFLNENLVLYRTHDTNITGKLSIGAKKNILVLNDLFRKYEFGLLNRLKAYSLAYCKWFFYKMTNK